MKFDNMVFEIADHLDSFFSKDLMVDLQALCINFEEAVLQLLKDYIANYFRSYAEKNQVNFSTVRNEGLVIGESTYFLNIQSESFATLKISFYPMKNDPDAVFLIHGEHNILESTGRYNKILITMPEALSSELENLTVLISTILSSAYRWFEGHMFAVVNQVKEDAIQQLYYYMRKRLPDHISDYVWFYLISESKAVYVVDRIGMHTALERAKKRSIDTPFSPFEVVASFTSVVLPFENTHSYDAHHEGRTIVLELERAKYASTGLQIAEHILLESGGLVIHPLITQDRTCLSAGYPPNMRVLLEPFFEREKSRYLEIVKHNTKKWSNIIDQMMSLRTPPSFAGKLAYLGGQFARGLFDV